MNPPDLLDGMKVIARATTSGSRPTGACRHIVGTVELGPVSKLALCEDADGSGFYLFHCDAEWQVLADSYFETEQQAIDQAAFEYKGVSLQRRPTVDKHLPT